ncbi:MAG: multidrug effflux MFS transporter [Victivallales bacterium]|nr:multidrug effflux MFS transporter [Victivallales bacterium]
MEKSIKLTIAISLMFASFGQIASDLYLPSLPHITVDLHTTRELVQLTVTCFMITYCLARLFYGPFSDGVGRKKPLIIGFVLTLIGSFICLIAKDIYILMAGRLLQGAGAAAGSVLTGAILRDMLEGKQLSKFISYFAVINIIFVAAAPLAGGYLQAYFNWRSTFFTLFLYTMVILIITVFIFPETNRKRDKKHIQITGIGKNIKVLLSSKQFIGYVIMVMAGYTSVLAWLTSGTIILQKQLQYSPVQFGWFALLGGLAFCVASFMNAKIVMKIKNRNLVLFGTLLMFLAGLIFLLTALFRILNIYSVMIPVIIFSFGNGFIFPNSFSGALNPFAEQAGFASAILSSMQILGGVIGSALVATLPWRSILSLGFIVTACGVIQILTILSVNRRFRIKIFLFFYGKRVSKAAAKSI